MQRRGAGSFASQRHRRRAGVMELWIVRTIFLGLFGILILACIVQQQAENDCLFKGGEYVSPSVCIKKGSLIP